MKIQDVIIMLVITAGCAVFSYFKFFKKYKHTEVLIDDSKVYQIPYLVEQIKNTFDDILKTDYTELNLNKEETEKSRKNKDSLRLSLKKCTHGNLGAKMYIVSYIEELLQKKLGITPETINRSIPFDHTDQLSAEYKFMILLHIYKKKFDTNAMEEFIIRNKLDEPRGEGTEVYYRISASDIDTVFRRHSEIYDKFTFSDKLSILAQKIYQNYKGLGVIDDIRFMKIDGLNAGTSGVPDTFYSYGADNSLNAEPGELPLKAYNGIWLMFKGKKINLAFIGFEKNAELERVTKNICRYNNAPTLSRTKGYIVNTSEDGCRIVGVRPEMSESWAFFIRKFDAASRKTLKDLYPFEGVEKLSDLLHHIIAGCRNTMLTGQQATGKTTALMSLIGYIPTSFSIRVQEMAFELYLRKVYNFRNILSFMDTPTVSAKQGIELQKKTDGDVNLFGEIAQQEVIPLAVKMGQTGSALLLGTSHHKTTDDLVNEWADGLVAEGVSTDSKKACETVAQVLDFDIHLTRTIDGVRAIERVTEILPHVAEAYPEYNPDDPAFSMYTLQREFYYRVTDRRVFDTQDIIIYDDGVYRFVNDISPDCVRELRTVFKGEQGKELDKFLDRMHEEVIMNRKRGYVGFSSMDSANHLYFGKCVDENNNVIGHCDEGIITLLDGTKMDMDFNVLESVPSFNKKHTFTPEPELLQKANQAFEEVEILTAHNFTENELQKDSTIPLIIPT